MKFFWAKISKIHFYPWTWNAFTNAAKTNIFDIFSFKIWL